MSKDLMTRDPFDAILGTLFEAMNAGWNLAPHNLENEVRIADPLRSSLSRQAFRTEMFKAAAAMPLMHRPQAYALIGSMCHNARDRILADRLSAQAKIDVDRRGLKAMQDYRF